MAELPVLLLASVALVVHALLLLLAPFAAEIAAATTMLLSGRTPPPIGEGWRALAGRVRSRDRAVRFPPAALAGAGFVVAAALLVPSFATGMLTAPVDDLPLVALLLVAGRLAGSCGAGPVKLARELRQTVLIVPALLLASLALSFMAGSTGLDAAIAAAPNAAAVPLGLVALALALAAVADGAGGEAAADLAGPVLALVTFTGQLRMLVWLDLVAVLLPPWSTTPSFAGPADWLAALLIWPVKIGLLAIALGVCRLVLEARPPRWRGGALRAASLLALLGGVFVLIGQSFE